MQSSVNQIICIHLKNWPIDLHQRRKPANAPLVLIQTTGQRQRVAAVCELAKKHRVAIGMNLTQARALCMGLTHDTFDPRGDAKSLQRLARWLMRFSPIVSPQPPDSIFLDASGCERLFGGAEPIARKISAALIRLKITAALAVAPTAGAAFALASTTASQACILCKDDKNIAEQLSPLPVQSLRIDPLIAEKLRYVGIETIGQLLKFPRKTLPPRFGEDLLLRLDQLLGEALEPLIPLRSRSKISASIEFEGPVDSLEAIWEIFKHLLTDIILQLLRRGSGARELLARFSQAYAPPIEKRIILSRPSRDASNLLNLLRCATEHVHSRDGFIGISIDVPSFEKISAEQSTLTNHEQLDAEKELGLLIDRLHARLNRHSLQQAKLIESYIPEHAFAVAEPSLKQTFPRKPLIENACTTRRPLRLLHRPVEIGVMVSPSEYIAGGRPVSFTHNNVARQLRTATGPERIAGQWWDGHGKTRDYFDAEDISDHRFWIFRVMETSRWYLHGIFE